MWWKVVLVIRGLDRLIMELKLPPTDSYHQSNVFRHFAVSKATCSQGDLFASLWDHLFLANEAEKGNKLELFKLDDLQMG
ncbi:hypothetical protein AK812_SmicGene30560 [Symbiodinium microadriaticum]|uniref:Uncharacterized protein n=1 Tax=Symbiodinium microadriaticum TaxID=2951 RepID=A0A1Q9CZ20_SYMMI|nr:hypothetical protein AK812_SmicGene30560 [Symbiodinium microadriaticum]